MDPWKRKIEQAKIQEAAVNSEAAGIIDHGLGGCLTHLGCLQRSSEGLKDLRTDLSSLATREARCKQEEPLFLRFSKVILSCECSLPRNFLFLIVEWQLIRLCQMKPCWEADAKLTRSTSRLVVPHISLYQGLAAATKTSFSCLASSSSAASWSAIVPPRYWKPSTFEIPC